MRVTLFLANLGPWLESITSDAGGRPQRLSWANIGTKDPAALEILHVNALAAEYHAGGDVGIARSAHRNRFNSSRWWRRLRRSYGT
jgi:hypothetical protein